MDKLFFWILIGALGFLLYIAPGYFIHRMYEGFWATATGVATTAAAAAEAAKAEEPTQQVNTAGSTIANLQPSSPPAQPTPTTNQIQNLMELLNTSVPLESPTAPPAIGTASAGTAQPVEYETTRSRPESTRVLPGPSEALKHGDLYNSTLPRNPVPGTLGMIGSMGTQPRAPAERIEYIERPSDNYERPPVSPNCPDMRDYIRKDSIPCWGCKLR
jgi:hypothetical protein